MQPENKNNLDEKDTFTQPNNQIYYKSENLDDSSLANNEFDNTDDTENDLKDNIQDNNDNYIKWQASEYINKYKSPIWYVSFIVIVVLLILVAIFLMKSWTFAILIPVMAYALFVYSARPPVSVNYLISDKGIFINDKLHHFSEFKAYGVVTYKENTSIELIPVKRFRPGITINLIEDIKDNVLQSIGNRLPVKEIKSDYFDNIARFLGF